MSIRGTSLLLLLALCALFSACQTSVVADIRDGGIAPALAAVIGLGLTGLALLMIAALFLLRKRRRARARAQVVSDVAPLSALSERTRLDNGQYEVLQVRQTSPFNVYVVRGTTPLSLCPSCSAQIDGDEMRFCTHCGADLRDMTLVYPRYLALESRDVSAFAESSQLVAQQLRHPNVVLSEAVFAETAFDVPRYYRIDAEFKPAADLSVPQSAETVLGWGIALARGLAYLHQHYVVLRAVDLDHVVVNHARAQCVGIDNAYVLPQDAYGQAATYFAQNVQALARVLLAMLTGDSQAVVDVQVPEEIAALLVKSQQTDATADALATALEQALYNMRAPGQVHFTIGQLTDVGRVRSLNEDSVLAMNLTDQFRTLGLPVSVVTVADGMGGHAAGDVASQLAIRAVTQQTEALTALANGRAVPDAKIWLEQAVVMANNAVYAQRISADSDMGCTLVLALLIGGKALIANVGDSRAYRLTPGGIARITTDHSLVERLVAVGQITPEEAREHPQRNIIYRVVGDKPKPEFDLFEQMLLPGEALLLCSDGLSGMLTDERIWQVWQATSSPQAACARLVDAANRAGGRDNISVVIAQVLANGVHA